MPKVPAGIWAVSSQLNSLVELDDFLISADAADCMCMRRPNLEAREMLPALNAMAANHSVMTHGLADWAQVSAASGVICGVQSLSPQISQELYPELLVGASVHNSQEVDIAINANVDFLVYGPVWDTPSKQDFLSARGLESLREVVERGTKVIAIGGILTASQVLQLKSCGVHGVAVLRAATNQQLMLELQQAFSAG
jgi:thiamine-phosphate diphosphorylase